MKFSCFQLAIISTIYILTQINLTLGGKILFFMGLSGYSHRVALEPLALKLADVGHEVTFLSPIHQKLDPKYQNKKIVEFCPSLLAEKNQELLNEQGTEAVLGRLKDKHYNPFFDTNELWDLLYDFGSAVVSSPDFPQWLNNSKFDLVITEHPSKEVSFGIAYKLNAKIITFSPSSHLMTENDMFGFPSESSWHPDITWGSSVLYDFIPERFIYTFNSIYFYLSYTMNYLPRLDSLLRATLGEGIPPLEQLIRNTSLYFINLHFSNGYAKSVPPFVVPVGGMHIQETRGILPKKIADFIDGNETEGFIYVSFGSILKISALPLPLQQIFFASMGSFENVKFLWKWEGDVPESLPKNILTMKWMPQQDLLAHPKCQGFISQGGLMSFQQASYFGIPLIIFPIFWDQPFNARLGVHHGIAIHLELSELSLERLTGAIQNILYNDSYSSRSKEVSKRFKDRPMSALETAVWWTEYVLRHNDTSHLKPLGIHQHWWQRYLLDFWAVVFTVLIAVLCLAYYILFKQLLRVCLVCIQYVIRMGVKINEK